MFYEELKQIIRLVLQQGLSGQALMDVLTTDVNPTEIYASDDMLAMDSYFSLLHYASGEEVVADAEWKYFLDCLKIRTAAVDQFDKFQFCSATMSMI